MTDARYRMLLTGLGLWLGLSGAAGAGEWHVDTKAKDNSVEFTSQVLHFTFTGTTDRVDGYIYWEGESLFQDKAQLLFECDLNSLDTGIGKRDRDMRDVLNTKQWPKARYKADITGFTKLDTVGASSSRGPGVTAYRVTTKGTFSLHGIDREMEIPGTVTIGPDTTRVRAQFQLRLEDFDIEAPSLAAFVKVSQEIDVDVVLTMKPVQKGGGDR